LGTRSYPYDLIPAAERRNARVVMPQDILPIGIDSFLERVESHTTQRQGLVVVRIHCCHLRLA
jgi:hypothetical protein